MKKIISILTALFLCAQTVLPVFADETEPIEAEFTDINFLTAVREKIGKTNGEHIYKSDVESITELKVPAKKITDFHGIEYFTNLNSFQCTSNRMEELDLSHNTELRILDCSNNVKLKSIDISHNPELERLYCNFSGITALDISQNTKLKTLLCHYSSIEELNLENNPLLETLNASRLKLTSLNVSANKNLRQFDCSYNLLTELDLSNNLNFDILVCRGNYMDKNPQNGIIGYDAIAERLGEPSEGSSTSKFVYYPQNEKAAENTYSYEITGSRIIDTSGEAMERPQKNKSFIVEADMTKTKERDEKDYLFAAVYDTDGALISLDYVKAKFVADGECSFGFNIPAQEKAVGSVKAFVWNAFNSMEPLAESKTLTFTDN